MRTKTILLLISALLLFTACQTAAPAEPEPETAVSAPTDTDSEMMEADSSEMAMEEDSSEMSAGMHDDMVDDDEMTAESADGMDEEMTESDQAEDMMANTEMETAAAWATTPLTNARTGETFTLADFMGQTVFVEPMATWCTNCLRQLGTVRDVQAQLTNENVTFVALSVETNIDDSELAAYAVDRGFDFVFAVATPELLEMLVAQFGQSVINPPSTPHFIISPDGAAGELDTGFESADELLAQIESASQ